jgi:hypothetical protein
MKEKLLLVDWVDITTGMLWKCEGEFDEPITCQSIGWIHNEDKKYLRLIATRSGEETCQRIVIPKGCILKRKEIKC